MRSISRLKITCLLIMTMAFLAESTQAIPAFARKYGMSCTTCHTMVPKLKEFGEDFAGNAFIMEGQEPARAVQDVGDELLRLQRDFPIAVRFDAFVRADLSEDETYSDLQTPWGLKLLSGGNVTEKIAYYLYFYMSEHGKVAGVEDAYLYFADLFGSGIGLTVGQFQVCDPLFKRELRLTHEDYQLYKVKVGYEPASLAYDRGLMLDWGAPWGTDVFLEVVNGNGIGASLSDYYDYQDSYKNVFLRLSQGLGLVRLGGFGYYGQSQRTDYKNTMLALGPDATLSVSTVEVNFQYLWRQDDNPWLSLQPQSGIITTGLLVEAIYSPEEDRSRWNMIGLYNEVTSDAASDYKSASLTANYLLARNLRLLGEVKYDILDEKAIFIVGLVSAF